MKRVFKGYTVEGTTATWTFTDTLNLASVIHRTKAQAKQSYEKVIPIKVVIEYRKKKKKV